MDQPSPKRTLQLRVFLIIGIPREVSTKFQGPEYEGSTGIESRGERPDLKRVGPVALRNWLLDLVDFLREARRGVVK